MVYDSSGSKNTVSFELNGASYYAKNPISCFDDFVGQIEYVPNKGFYNCKNHTQNLLLLNR